LSFEILALLALLLILLFCISHDATALPDGAPTSGACIPEDLLQLALAEKKLECSPKSKLCGTNATTIAESRRARQLTKKTHGVHSMPLGHAPMSDGEKTMNQRDHDRNSNQLSLSETSLIFDVCPATNLKSDTVEATPRKACTHMHSGKEQL
jgi:hypothetical protein